MLLFLLIGLICWAAHFAEAAAEPLSEDRVNRA
jgi:hypothetical protein